MLVRLFNEVCGYLLEGKNLSDDAKLTQKALLFAAFAHAGQTLNDGKPYLSHPITVANDFDNTKQWRVCILHDTIEDARKNRLDITSDTLRELGFPEDEVIEVDSLSRKVTKDSRQLYGPFLVDTGYYLRSRLGKRGDFDSNLQEWRDPALVLSPHQKEKRIIYIVGLDYSRSLDLLHSNKRQTKQGTTLDVFISRHPDFKYFAKMLNPIMKNIMENSIMLPALTIPKKIQAVWTDRRKNLYDHPANFFNEVAEISKDPFLSRQLRKEIEDRLDGTQWHLDYLDEKFETARQADIVARFYLRSVTEFQTKAGTSVASYLRINKKLFFNKKNPDADLTGTIKNLLNRFYERPAPGIKKQKAAFPQTSGSVADLGPYIIDKN